MLTTQAQVPSLGVVIRQQGLTNKLPIVLALHHAPLPTAATATLAGKKTADASAKSSEGYFISRKGSRDLDDEYAVKGKTSKKTAGAIQIQLPHYGISAGTAYVVLEVKNREFLMICSNKIRVDGACLLEEVSAAAYATVVQELLQLEQEYPGANPPALDPLRGTTCGGRGERALLFCPAFRWF